MCSSEELKLDNSINSEEISVQKHGLDINQSQTTLCKSIGLLKMGKSRGRPKKNKLKGTKNPFEIGFGLKKNLRCKAKGMGVVNFKRNPILKSIPEENFLPSQDEASLIVESALLMGLELPQNVEQTNRIIASHLEAGSL